MTKPADRRPGLSARTNHGSAAENVPEAVYAEGIE